MIPLWMELPCSLCVTCGFCIIFNVPARKIPLCLIVGSAAWMTYEIFIYFGLSSVFSAFIAACLVWLLSNIFARAFRETSTMFIIPGIICLVPGSGAYYSMLAILGHHSEPFSTTARETLLTAGAIAAGLLLMGSITGVFLLLTQKMRVAHSEKNRRS